MPDSGWVILELLDDYSPRKYWTEIKKQIKLNIDDDLYLTDYFDYHIAKLKWE